MTEPKKVLFPESPKERETEPAPNAAEREMSRIEYCHATKLNRIQCLWSQTPVTALLFQVADELIISFRTVGPLAGFKPICQRFGLTAEGLERNHAIRMDNKTLEVTINGTGFAAVYSAQTYGMIPHKMVFPWTWQGSPAPAYDTPSLSGGRSLFN